MLIVLSPLDFCFPFERVRHQAQGHQADEKAVQLENAAAILISCQRSGFREVAIAFSFIAMKETSPPTSTSRVQVMKPNSGSARCRLPEMTASSRTS